MLAHADESGFFELIAEFLDVAYPEDEQEAQFFLRAAGPGPRRLLELGIGTGRIGLAFARAGWEVVGVDRSAPALRLLEGKVAAEPGLSLRTVHADVVEVVPGETFDVVLACGLFFHLPDAQAYQQVLQSAAARLAPGGVLLFDVECRPDGGWKGDGLVRFKGRVRRDDGWVSLYQASTLSESLRQQWGVFTLEESGDDGVVRGRRVFHEISSYTTLSDLEPLIEKAGLRVEHRWGDYSGSSYVDGRSPELIIGAVREAQ